MKKVRITLGMICMLLLFTTAAYAQTYYVDAKTTGGNGSKEKPFTKIQQAADIVEPGDTVLIEPGIYCEQVDIKRSGTKEKPIVFRATEFGKNKVIITEANKDIRDGKVKWTLEDKELNIYSIPYTGGTVGSLLYDDLFCFQASSLDGVKELKYDTYTLPPTVFYNDRENKKIYLRMRTDGKYTANGNPNEHVICVGGPFYHEIMIDGVMQIGERACGISEKSYCVGIVTENDAYITLYGLTFEAPGYAGVYVRGNNVTVSNCWFKGCRGGVVGGMRARYDAYKSDDVTIEYCDWNLYPMMEEAREIIQEVGVPGTQVGLHNEFYWYMKASRGGPFDYEAGGVFASAGDNWTLRNSNVSSCLDGISFWHSIYGYTPVGNSYAQLDGKNYHYYENHFENCLDNAVEFENGGKNYDVHHNEMINCFAAFSWQPLNGEALPTNIDFYNNILYQDEEYTNERLAIGSTSEPFKIGGSYTYSHDTQKHKIDSTTNILQRPFAALDRGVNIYNNSVYYPNVHMMQLVGNYDNNSYYANNIFYFYGQPDPMPRRTFIKPGTMVAENKMYLYEGNMFIPSNSEIELNSSHFSINRGWIFKTFEEAGVEVNGYALEVSKNSVANEGGEQVPHETHDTKYVGPVKANEDWHINYAPYPYGDTNCDNVVDMKDVEFIGKYIGAVDGEEKYNTRCDLNFDDVIDQKDLEMAVLVLEGLGV